jgi:hypothetical protein
MNLEGNPLMIRMRTRQGRWGMFHRSNLGSMLAATAIALAVMAILMLQGVEALDTALVLAAGLLLGMALFTATVSVWWIVRAGRRSGMWEEMLLTRLSSRELTNGILVMAMRPVINLVRMTMVIPVALALAMSAVLLADGMVTEGFGLLIGLALLLTLFLGVTVAVVLFVATLSLSHVVADEPGPSVITRILALTLGGLFLLSLPHLLVFLLLLLPCVLPGICWYQHRRLCATMRERLVPAA